MTTPIEPPIEPNCAEPPPRTSEAAPSEIRSLSEPTRASNRLMVLDVMRGVALFGIFMVNIPLFAMPMMEGFGGPTLADASRNDLIGWWIIELFFQFKFISMYSILFGAGFMLQRMRAERDGRSHNAVFVRRLLVLMVFGLIHALLIWYGDILLMYSMLGFSLLLLGGMSAKALIRVGLGVLIFSAVLMTGFGLLQAVMIPPQAESAVDATAAESADSTTDSSADSSADSTADSTADSAADDDGAEPAFGSAELVVDATRNAMAEAENAGQPPVDAAQGADADVEEDGDAEPAEQDDLRGFGAMMASKFNPFDERWMAAETAAFRDGPFRDAFTFRSILFVFGLLSSVFSWSWYVAGLFLFGAGLMKADFFAADKVRWHRGCALLAIPGFALQVAHGWIMSAENFQMTPGSALMGGPYALGAAMLTMGYIGIICLLVHARPSAAAFRVISKPGRMGLTGYLAESVLATAIMYWWGFAQFGRFDRLELIGIVIAIYTAILLFANIWFRFFAIGPLEWIWRSATYLRPISLRSGS